MCLDVEYYDFHERFKAIRIQKGISESEVANVMHRSVNHIKNIEKGLTFPTFRNFFKVCALFNITPFDFFNYDNIDPGLSFDLFYEISCLNENEKNHVFEIVKDITGNNRNF